MVEVIFVEDGLGRVLKQNSVGAAILDSYIRNVTAVCCEQDSGTVFLVAAVLDGEAAEINRVSSDSNCNPGSTAINNRTRSFRGQVHRLVDDEVLLVCSFMDYDGGIP